MVIKVGFKTTLSLDTAHCENKPLRLYPLGTVTGLNVVISLDVLIQHMLTISTGRELLLAPSQFPMFPNQSTSHDQGINSQAARKAPYVLSP